MHSQEPPAEKFKNINSLHSVEFVENAKKAVVYYDPLTNRAVTLYGSPGMAMSMTDYAKIRVPRGVAYNIIDIMSAPDEALPELNLSAYSDPSLNMFYRYLNAL